jgi:hypothetical protein
MTIRRVGAFVLSALLIQGAVVFSCGAQTMRMPCCTPPSNCEASFDTPPCCGFDAPVDRQVGGDRTGVVTWTAPVLSMVNLPAGELEALHDGFSRTGIAASPPRTSDVPLYLKFASILC